MSDNDLKNRGYKFLGWMNGWDGLNFPSEFINCRKEKHKTIEISYSNRGYDNTVYCETCKIYYKYDSSD